MNPVLNLQFFADAPTDSSASDAQDAAVSRENADAPESSESSEIKEDFSPRKEVNSDLAESDPAEGDEAADDPQTRTTDPTILTPNGRRALTQRPPRWRAPSCRPPKSTPPSGLRRRWRRRVLSVSSTRGFPCARRTKRCTATSFCVRPWTRHSTRAAAHRRSPMRCAADVPRKTARPPPSCQDAILRP